MPTKQKSSLSVWVGGLGSKKSPKERSFPEMLMIYFIFSSYGWKLKVGRFSFLLPSHNSKLDG